MCYVGEESMHAHGSAWLTRRTERGRGIRCEGREENTGQLEDYATRTSLAVAPEQSQDYEPRQYAQPTLNPRVTSRVSHRLLPPLCTRTCSRSSDSRQVHRTTLRSCVLIKQLTARKDRSRARGMRTRCVGRSIGPYYVVLTVRHGITGERSAQEL